MYILSNSLKQISKNGGKLHTTYITYKITTYKK